MLETLLTYPIIPILAFVGIGSFFVYQLSIFLKERKKSRVPTLPKLNTDKLSSAPSQLIQKIDKIAADSQKVNHKDSRFRKVISIMVVAFIGLNAFGILYFIRGQRTTFVPRANIEPTSPLRNLMSPTPMPTETITSEEGQETTTAPSPAQNNFFITPTVNPSITLLPTRFVLPTGPTVTSKPAQMTATLVPTKAPTATPTSTPAPTLSTTKIPSPTLITKLIISPTAEIREAFGKPTSTPLSAQKPTSTVSPIKSPTITLSPTTIVKKQGSSKNIPTAGVGLTSVFILSGSLFLILLGFLI